MFGIIYWLGAVVLYIIALPILCILTLSKQKYKDSIPARFFLRNYHNHKTQVWIHACSLGEVSALEEIIRHIHSTITLSVITNTGFKRANELFGKEKNIHICYLPFEIFLPFVMPKETKKLIVLEAELWYMLFFVAKNRGAKTILLNARISSKSYPRYKKNAWFYRIVFRHIDTVLCQQQIDKERLQMLGAKNIDVVGNIKALNTPKVTKNLAKFAGILIVGASTHAQEEELIIQSYIKAFKNTSHDKLNNDNTKDKRLIIAPRHPHRFNEVWNLLQQYPLKSAKYSKNGLDYNYEVILLDTIGELINIYNIADLVILGGSFVKVGGHNPLECAYFHTKILSGEYIFNQLSLFDMIEGYTIANSNELWKYMANLKSLPNSKILQTDIQSIIKHIE